MDTTVCFVMAELIIKNHWLAASWMLIMSGTLGLLKMQMCLLLVEKSK